MTVSEAGSHGHRCRIGDGTRLVEARAIELQLGTPPNDAGTSQQDVETELS